MFKSILVPLDGSDISESVLSCALDWAKQRQARTYLVRVVEHVAELAPGLPPELVPEVQRKNESQALSYLEEQAVHFAPLEVIPCVPVGSPRDKIVEIAQQYACELIMMASHGRDGAEHWLLGSVAESVLRQAPCPVLLTRPGAAPTSHFNHILVPTDGSEASLSILEQIKNLLAPGGRITLLQSSGISLYPNFTNKSSVVDQYLDKLEARLRQVSYPGLHMDVVVLDGDPVSDILTWSQDQGCDLIAMTTHGRSGFRRFWLGSVSEKVARHAHCHIFIVRPGNSD